MSESPISLRDETGVERFRGTQSPGGGSAPSGISNYAGHAVTLANGASGTMPFDDLAAGVDLLDRTDPAVPAVLVSAVYSVAVTLSPAALTAGGSIYVNVILGFNLSEQMSGATFGVAGGPFPPQPCISLVAALSAGDTLTVQAGNFDGAAQRDFLMAASVQRIA